jgi:hypothetical protein
MFLLYHSEECNICELVLYECYVNDLYTTTCSGMLGHHNKEKSEFHVLLYSCAFLTYITPFSETLLKCLNYETLIMV